MAVRGRHRKAENIVVLGAQWGDEGKAKMVDVLTEQVDVVARYQGGSNAGHTVVTGGRQFVFHQIPSGILHPGKTCLIGNGVVLDVPALLSEIDDLIAGGVRVEGRLVVSDRAHLLMPYHRLLDGAAEIRKGSGKIGTTNRGIGPAYMDKMARTGLRVCDLFQPRQFRRKVQEAVREKNFWLRRYYRLPPIRADRLADEYLRLAARIRPWVRDTSAYLQERLDAGHSLLAEGAQGTLLDVDFGTYPYVTSSSAGVGGVFTGLGIGPFRLDQVYGVAKAYATRVGEGPFPTEMSAALGDRVRRQGGEYGATTGRPRRCGWLDGVALRYAARVNGFTGLLLTKLDVLSRLSRVKVAVAYRYGGRRLENFPAHSELLAKCRPVYREFPGWEEDLSEVTSWRRLPPAARRYVAFVERFTGVPVRWVSVGQDRRQIFPWKGEDPKRFGSG